jgi:hypothetical protein
MDWNLMLIYLIMGAPAWSSAMLYVAFRVIRTSKDGEKSKIGIWVRSILVFLSVVNLAVFGYFIIGYSPQ